MKLIEHEKSGKPEAMTLSHDPMIVWFNRNIELRIEKGDTIKQIGLVISRYWDIQREKANEIAALWFSLGERRASKKTLLDWKESEKNADPKRRYLRR